MAVINNKDFKIIGICAADILEENVSDVLRAISETVTERGYKVFLFNPFRNLFDNSPYDKGEASIYRLVNPDIVDLLIILSESIKNTDVVDGIIHRARENNLPTIVVEEKNDECNSIIFNYTNAFEKLVRHIVEYHNCKRVNFIAGIEGNSFSKEREDIYKKVLAENGIAFEQERLGYGGFWDKPTQEVMKAFMESSLPFPEAIICCNDAMAITACRVLRENGYRVPEDVLVTGFDGIELERYSVPRLTTAAMDTEGIGIETANLVERVLNGQSDRELIEIQYIPRFSQSCGCKPVKNELIGDKVSELYNRINMSNDQESYMFLYHSQSVTCKTDQEMSDVMRYFGDTWFWCCINSDFFNTDFVNNPVKRDEDNPFTEQMILFSQGKETKATDCKAFSRKNLLPKLDEILEEHNYLFFCPLHFIDEVIGYLAISFENFNFTFAYTKRFLDNTNQILESYKNRRQLVVANAALAEMHKRDPMTGIYNRRGFYRQLRTSVDLYKERLAFVFSIDMDNLKDINDTFGHNEGDRAIKALSESISTCSSESDICSRFGGDEFIIVSFGSTSEQLAESYISRINEHLQSFNEHNEVPYNVVISCGYLEANDLNEDNVDEYIKLADERMYEQKRKHKSGKVR